MFYFLQECLRIAIGSKGYSYPSGIWRRSLLSLPNPIFGGIWALYGQYCVLNNKHTHLLSTKAWHSILMYYKAFSLYICGRFVEALSYAQQFCRIAPDHREGAYLLSDILFELGKKEEAFQILCNSFLSKRKTWVKLANLVESPEDYLSIRQIYDSAINKGKISFGDSIILESIAMGAQRAGKYDEAIHIWEHIITLPRLYTSPKKKLTSKSAEAALKSLTQGLEKADLKAFLISGTLLGFIRDGDFLSYDTDLDIGVFDDVDPLLLRQAVYATGCFTIMPQRTKHCLRVRHVNGTPIDIFTHYRSPNDYWHREVKVSWHNSPFELKRANFKGISVFIPSSPEAYLKENYGEDWIIPKKEFDSAKDCPNLRVENRFEIQIHDLRYNKKHKELVK